MTVFRQENLEEHYETGEDLGRWVRAEGAAAAERGRPCPPCLSSVSDPPREGTGRWI